MSIATELTLTIHAWLNKPGVAASSGPGPWWAIGPKVGLQYTIHESYPIGSMYVNIGGILMVNLTIYIYIAYMDPMGTTSSWANMVINFDLWVAYDYHDWLWTLRFWYLPTYPLVIWEILGAIQGREICQHTVVAEVHWSSEWDCDDQAPKPWQTWMVDDGRRMVGRSPKPAWLRTLWRPGKGGSNLQTLRRP